MNGQSIRVVGLSGSPFEMGRTHGGAFGPEIREYADGRIELSKTGTDWTTEEILALAERMLPAHEMYDADIYAEMVAMAEAAGLSAAEAVVVGGYTDFVDTVRAYAGGTSVENNCTALLVPDGMAGGNGYLAQTWDMNSSATPHIVLLDVEPTGGPRALVFTTVGALGQIGMNEAGIAIGINNLTAADGRLGVTWPFVIRKALRQSTFDDAVRCVVDADLAGGHSFLIFDNGGQGVAIEAMPTATHIEELADSVLAHTNHCLVPTTRAVEGAYPDDLRAGSVDRLEHATELLQAPVTVEEIMELTRDERAICRHPGPVYDYETCGAAIMRPATGDFWACWGIPSENAYEHFRIWEPAGV